MDSQGIGGRPKTAFPFRMMSSFGDLANLNVNGFDMRNVTDTRYMFFGCDKLTGVDLSRFQ